VKLESVRPAGTACDTAPRDPGLPQTVREAAQEFESLFIAQIMQTMRRTAPETGLVGAGGGGRLFREMLDQELSKEIAHSGGFGIAEILFRQLAPEGAGQERPVQERDHED
jgi:flagellar protein FlgJ